jgi:hypothetical protein
MRQCSGAAVQRAVQCSAVAWTCTQEGGRRGGGCCAGPRRAGPRRAGPRRALGRRPRRPTARPYSALARTPRRRSTAASNIKQAAGKLSKNATIQEWVHSALAAFKRGLCAFAACVGAVRICWERGGGAATSSCPGPAPPWRCRLPAVPCPPSPPRLVLACAGGCGSPASRRLNRHVATYESTAPHPSPPTSLMQQVGPAGAPPPPIPRPALHHLPLSPPSRAQAAAAVERAGAQRPDAGGGRRRGRGRPRRAGARGHQRVCPQGRCALMYRRAVSVLALGSVLAG